VGCASAVGAGVPQQVRRNEICTLLPAFAPVDPRKENTTITPIPGDLCWSSFDSDDLGNPAYGYENTTGTGTTGAIIDLDLFYGAEQPADQRRPGLGAWQCLRRRRGRTGRYGRRLSGPVDGRVRGETLSFHRRD